MQILVFPPYQAQYEFLYDLLWEKHISGDTAVKRDDAFLRDFLSVQSDRSGTVATRIATQFLVTNII